MKKNGLIAAVALFVAAIGVLIALAAYFKNRKSCLCDCEDEEDFYFDDPDDLEYYAADFDNAEEAAQEAPEQEADEAEESAAE